MFLSLSLCTVNFNQVSDHREQARVIHYIALGADVVLGVGLLIIGILAIQLGFLPNSMQYAFIGAGAAYSIAILSLIGAEIKEKKGPDDCYLIK